MTCVSESVECVPCLLSDGYFVQSVFVLITTAALLLIMYSVNHLMLPANTDTLGLHLFDLRYYVWAF